MFERFTEKAIKVIMLAQEEARRLGHNFVGTEQVLLGLIGESTGVGAKALKTMGVTLKDARAEVEKIIGRGSGFVAVAAFVFRVVQIIVYVVQSHGFHKIQIDILNGYFAVRCIGIHQTALAFQVTEKGAQVSEIFIHCF